MENKEENMLRTSQYPMVSVADALRIVMENTKRRAPIKVPALSACGYIAAEDVLAESPYPTFRASIMDGYAVKGPFVSGRHKIEKRLHAGSKDDTPLSEGHVCYITTGAKLPEGADAVVKVEDTAFDSEEFVQINVDCASGVNVRQVGSDIAVNDILLKEGHLIAPADIGLLATGGVSWVSVHSQPTVGVMSTGDELVDANTTPPQGSQINDCNRPMLIAAFAREGYRTVDLGIVADMGDQLSEKLSSAAATCEVVVTSGGVSMGDADLLKETLIKTGATIGFGRLNMKPGKPTTFAVYPDKGTLVFALPGNPVSCLVTKSLLVDPALRVLRGLTPAAAMPVQIEVRLADTLKLDKDRPEYHRASLQADPDSIIPIAESTGNQRSSRLLSMQQCDALLCLPQGTDAVPEVAKGHLVPALLLNVGFAGSRGGLPDLPDPRQNYFSAAATCADPGLSSIPAACATSLPQPPPPTAVPSHPRDGMPERVMRVGVITVSDRASCGVYADESGPLIRRLLHEVDFAPYETKMAKKGLVTKALRAHCPAESAVVVPDEISHIQRHLKIMCTPGPGHCDVVLTTGGTGFGLRDTTPEAVTPMLDREAPGVAQALLHEGLQHTPLAVLARPVVGVKGTTLVATLPGSTKAVAENIQALFPLLPRIMELLMSD